MAMYVLPGSFPAARAQEPAETQPAWTPRTGDAWVDAALVDMGTYAGKHRDAFVDELVRYQSVPREPVETALAWGMPAGDVYFACAMAQALGRPCRELLDARQRDAAADWQGITAAIDPGQSEAALRRVRIGIVASYARWARPIEP